MAESQCNDNQLAQTKSIEKLRSGGLVEAVKFIKQLSGVGYTIYKAFQTITEKLPKLGDLDRFINEIEGLFNKNINERIMAEEYDKIRKPYIFEELGSNHDFTAEVLSERIMKCDPTELKNVKDEIICEMRESLKSDYNKIIKDMVLANGLVAAISFVKIISAWHEISKASNVISNTKKFDQINKNLKTMETMVMEQIDICHMDNPDIKTSNHLQAEIDTHYTSTVVLLNDIEAKIDGHVQKLGIIGNYAVVDAGINTVTAVTEGIQLWSTWNNLTTLIRAFGVFSVGLFAGNAACNVAIFYYTQDQLTQLRKDMEEVKRLKERLHELHEEAVDNFKKLKLV